MQSEAPAIIIGHWNYPAPTSSNYRYEEKRFNGTYWEGTGVWHTRDPHHKTVYVVASYPVAAVELYVNGRRVGRCDKPQNTFVFAFPGVDVTQSGWVEAVGYGYDGTPSASDRLETADSPAALRLTLHTAPGGLAADGADIAYVDIADAGQRRAGLPALRCAHRLHIGRPRAVFGRLQQWPLCRLRP